MKLFVTSPKGITHLLVQELIALGAQDVVEAAAGARCEADLATAYGICLWSRVANRVLLPIAAFNASTPEELYDHVKKIAWEEHLRADGTLAVDCTAIQSAITHTHYASLKTKDAICDYFRDKENQRPSVDTETPDLRLHLHLQRKRATLSIDLSGQSLHQRGYRAAPVLAPLKENLAAALLLQAQWPELAKQGAYLVDPMCGSGTFLIEAAMIAADIAPGINRHYYGFLNWQQHDNHVWQALLQDARQRREVGLKQCPQIQGYDENNEAVRATQNNIERAQLRDIVHVERRNIVQNVTENYHARGLIITNPPYGDRLGDRITLRPVYEALGRYIKNAPAGWRAAIFTGNPELANYVGLKSDEARAFFNGDIECQLLRYRLHDQAMPTVMSVAPVELSAGAQSFVNRLQKNIKHYKKWAERENVACYRVYDKDLPEYGVAIDLYQNDKERWLHVQEYAAPKTVDADKAQQRLQEIFSVLGDTFQLSADRIYFKVRQKQKGSDQYEKFADRRQFHIVDESPARFYVNFSDYLDTGLFLDHRLTRKLLHDLANGKHFLNLFAYTGTASVHAGLGGAISTTTVDMSNTYLDWAQRNLELNDLRGRQHKLIQADCLQWLREESEREHPKRYDVIFLDPPTFSTSKRMQESFDVQRDHVEVLTLVMQLLDAKGTLIFSNNFRKFKLDEAALTTYIANVHIEDITAKTIPFDFQRNPRIHQCWKITRQASLE